MSEKSCNAWEASHPKLYSLLAEIDRFYRSNVEVQRRWMEQLATVRPANDAMDIARQEWREKRQRYAEIEVFRPGCSKLRDETRQPVDEMEWLEHHRKIEQHDLSDVPAGLRRGYYYTEHKSLRGWVRRRFPCFETNAAGATIQVKAWAPVELVAFNESRFFHAPLPPEEIGAIADRGYSLAESIYALTVLHDADGSFDFIAPATGPLRRSLGQMFEMDKWYAKHYACDWRISSLRQRVWKQVKASFEPTRLPEYAEFTTADPATAGSATSETKESATAPESAVRAMSAEARVLAVLTDHPDWTDAKIAATAGINRTSLYRLEKFIAARKLISRQGVSSRPRGSKFNGTVEAWDQDV